MAGEAISLTSTRIKMLLLEYVPHMAHDSIRIGWDILSYKESDQGSQAGASSLCIMQLILGTWAREKRYQRSLEGPVDIIGLRGLLQHILYYRVI